MEAPETSWWVRKSSLDDEDERNCSPSQYHSIPGSDLAVCNLSPRWAGEVTEGPTA